jgi:dTMP kinase|tara:strand:+ start:1426 stop:2052 length:627 start_codon:yes stop_codon:yes gene_type:complete
MTTSQFITFEGIEGVGKTTQIERLASYLMSVEIECYRTREPGGTKLADDIRAILANPSYQISDRAELLLMFASRTSHVDQVIIPQLERGAWVLCDRFVDASYAYQGAGRGFGEDVISYFEQLTCQNLIPDTTFLLDMPLSMMFDRIRQRSQGKDRIEREPEAFFQSVRTAYLSRAQKNPKQYVLIDASASIDEVTDQIISAIKVRYEI